MEQNYEPSTLLDSRLMTKLLRLTGSMAACLTPIIIPLIAIIAGAIIGRWELIALGGIVIAGIALLSLGRLAVDILSRWINRMGDE